MRKILPHRQGAFTRLGRHGRGTFDRPRLGGRAGRRMQRGERPGRHRVPLPPAASRARSDYRLMNLVISQQFVYNCVQIARKNRSKCSKNLRQILDNPRACCIMIVDVPLWARADQRCCGGDGCFPSVHAPGAGSPGLLPAFARVIRSKIHKIENFIWEVSRHGF